MSLILDPNDPTKTRVQYRNPKWREGTPRILFVMSEPDKIGNQILIMNGDGHVGLRQFDGRTCQKGNCPDDIINAPQQTAEELLEQTIHYVAEVLATTLKIETRTAAKKILDAYKIWKAAQ